MKLNRLKGWVAVFSAFTSWGLGASQAQKCMKNIGAELQ